jgi:hypothetical protein
MSSPSLIETTVQGEVFTHRVLWSAAQRHLRVARNDPNESWYFHLSAMLMGFMAFEAYINFLGTKLAPSLWKEERANFRTPPYKGTMGKLLKLCEMHEIPFPTKGTRPYQSVAVLNDLRDIVAHGKPDEFEFTVRHPADVNPATIKYSLDAYVSEKKAEQSLSDIKSLCDSLHKAFLEKSDIYLIYQSAFDGALAISIGHMSDEA